MEVIHPRLREVYCRVKSPGILALAPLLPFLDPCSRQCCLPREAPGNLNCAYTRPWQLEALSDRLLRHWPKSPLAADREETLRLKHSCGGSRTLFMCWPVPPCSPESIQETQRKQTPLCTNTK